MWLNLYGGQAVQRKLKKGIKMHFLFCFVLFFVIRLFKIFVFVFFSMKRLSYEVAFISAL